MEGEEGGKGRRGGREGTLAGEVHEEKKLGWKETDTLGDADL